jgi:hypothetical protein
LEGIFSNNREGGGPRSELVVLKESHRCWRVSILHEDMLLSDRTMRVTELGINFSHIRAKSMTVLNPLRRVDERIMDDADLAGPLLFFFCFGVLLLLVSFTL